MKYVPPRMYGPCYDFMCKLASGSIERLGIYKTFMKDHARIRVAQMKDANVIQVGVPEWAANDGGSLTQFTYDTITSGIFWPPFDSFFLEWEDSPLDKPSEDCQLYAAALCTVLVRRGKPTELLTDEATHIGKWAGEAKPTVMEVMGFSRLKDSDIAMLSDMTMIISADFGGHVIRGQELPRKNFIGNEIFAIQRANDEFFRDGGVTITNTCYAIGLMASKGPTLSTHRPDRRVAERRLQQRKTPWVTYQTLMLPGRGSGGSGTGIEGRSSPRLHWRRGHVRKRGDKYYSVVPHLVGASDMGRVISNYVVTKE